MPTGTLHRSGVISDSPIKNRACSNLTICWWLTHCVFVVVRMHPNLPIWIEVIGRLFFHPARESLIEPNVVPPSHCDQIAKPLMGDLVGHYRENTLLCEVRTRLRVEEEKTFIARDPAPIFHGTAK